MKFLLVYLLLGSFNAHASAPVWFSDYLRTYPGCDTDLLCTVGDGETLSDALTEARSEAAKYFQAEIKSKSQISSSSEQKGISAASGTFDQWTNKIVSVETSELISGLEIKRQEEVSGHVYVLMGLDKRKTAGVLQEKILEFDTENAQLLDLNSRFSYPKILKNLTLIDFYNNRYTLLAPNKIDLKVKRETIQEKINKLTKMDVAFITRGKKLSPKLNHTMINLMSPLKVVFVPKKKLPAFSLVGEVVIEEQYFKVAGFKKLNVIYKLELLNSKNEVMGRMSALSQQVARNSDHAIEKAIPEIKEALQNNLEQLSSK